MRRFFFRNIRLRTGLTLKRTLSKLFNLDHHLIEIEHDFKPNRLNIAIFLLNSEKKGGTSDAILEAWMDGLSSIQNYKPASNLKL